jgi:hypothetical protein
MKRLAQQAARSPPAGDWDAHLANKVMNKVIADNHNRVVELIRAAATRLGTPDGVVGRVIERMRPSIRLVACNRSAPRVGSSKAGGAPDLPRGMDWPLLVPEEDDSPPMWFVLQVDLAEAAPWDVEGLLPKEGLLSVFVNWEEGYFDESPYLLVHIFPPAGPPLRRLGFPDDLPAAGRFHEVALEAWPEWTIPSPEDSGEEPWFESPHLHLWRSEIDRQVFEIQGNPTRMASTHRLLGHPQLIQSPGVAAGTRLFLQVDSDDPWPNSTASKTGMRWGGGYGRLYAMLNEADLLAGRWGEIWSFAET